MTARRIQLDRDDELAGGELAPEQGRRPGDVQAGRRAHRDRADRDRRLSGLGPGRPPPVEDFSHRRDVLRGGAAAAADEPSARVHHPLGVLRHVGRGREIDQALADPARQAGVGLDTQGQPPGLGVHLLQHLVEGARADRAVRPEGLNRKTPQGARDLGRRSARERDAVVGERHLSDDRDVGDRADRRHGERDFLQVRKRLDDEAVDAALEEGLGLLPKRRQRLVGGDRSERRQILPEGPDRAEHEHVLARALAHVARERDTPPIHLAHLALEPVDRELEPVRAEGVGLDAIGAGGDVVGVDRLDHARVVQVEDVEARIERDTARVEQGSHRAVAQERPRAQTAAKLVRHAPPGARSECARRPGRRRSRSCRP